tara:strand:+ start:280 stop:447 length:168 start_codon:yes stop_codon:yes gene_type:complete
MQINTGSDSFVFNIELYDMSFKNTIELIPGDFRSALNSSDYISMNERELGVTIKI